MTPVRCKDCLAAGIKTARPAPYTGPRCTTHARAKKKADRRRAHGLYVERTYGLPAEKYWKLYDAQGGKCFICRRATGAARHLAVDHDHACCPELPACGKCVRFLGCGPCNSLLAHVRDDPLVLLRAIEVLVWPPAQRHAGWYEWPPVMTTVDQLVRLLETSQPTALTERVP